MTEKSPESPQIPVTQARAGTGTRKPKVTKSVLRASIQKNYGVISHVARDLKIDPKTVRRYIDKWGLTGERHEQREKLKDIAETNIITEITGNDNEESYEKETLNIVYDILKEKGISESDDIMVRIRRLRKKVNKYSDPRRKIETSQWFLERQAVERGYGNKQLNVQLDKPEHDLTDEELNAEITRLERERIQTEKRGLTEKS